MKDLTQMVKNFSIYFFSSYNQKGFGLTPSSPHSANFFLENNLSGPIFNNYDIGSYLIFYLYPREKVFVDNRPEAYSSDFFTNLYIPLQENETFWKESESQFNTIFFNRNDLTPWAQKFLINRIQDSSWAPVYIDSSTIIFLKRNEQNQNLITKFELPRSMFSIS